MPRESWREDDGEGHRPVELVDIKIAELSRVRSGATGREFFLLKSKDGRERPVDPLTWAQKSDDPMAEPLAIALCCPAEHEEEMNEMLEKVGIPARARNLLTAVLRIREGYADVWTDEVDRALERALAGAVYVGDVEVEDA